MPSLEILEIAQLITNLDCLFSMIFCLWIFFPNKGFVRKIFSFFSFGNYFLKFSALFFSHDKFRCQPRKAISYQFFLHSEHIFPTSRVTCCASGVIDLICFFPSKLYCPHIVYTAVSNYFYPSPPRMRVLIFLLPTW